MIHLCSIDVSCRIMRTCSKVANYLMIIWKHITTCMIFWCFHSHCSFPLTSFFPPSKQYTRQVGLKANSTYWCIKDRPFAQNMQSPTNWYITKRWYHLLFEYPTMERSALFPPAKPFPDIRLFRRNAFTFQPREIYGREFSCWFMVWVV